MRGNISVSIRLTTTTYLTMGLKEDHPHLHSPAIVCAPMRNITGPELAVEVTKAGGLGFLGAGYDLDDEQLSRMQKLLKEANLTAQLCVGFLNWGADRELAMKLMEKYRPRAVWFFVPSDYQDLRSWFQDLKQVSPDSRIWVQVTSVKESIEAARLGADVLVVQGSDAGGHGALQAASVLTLLPEVIDTLHTEFPKLQYIASGGIMDGRGVAAGVVLGAAGAVMGTRFLASHEAIAKKGVKDALVKTFDGGLTTVRTRVYDSIRGERAECWPTYIGGRVIINDTYHDHVAGITEDELRNRYNEARVQDDYARLNVFAGTGVGLVKEILPAAQITRDAVATANGLLKPIS